MATIPTQGVLPNSPLTALQAPAGSADAFGGASARGLSQLAAAGQQTADVFAKNALVAQDEQNTIDFNQADTEYAKAIQNLGFGPDGYFAKEGQAAVDGYGNVIDQAGKLKDQVLAKAPNDRVRQMLARALDQRELGFQDGAARFVTEKRKDLLISTAEARKDQAGEDAADNWNNEAKFRESLQVAVSEAQNLADIKGMSPEARAVFVRDTVSQITSMRLERMAQTDPGSVLSYINSDAGKAALNAKDTEGLLRFATAQQEHFEAQARQAQNEAEAAQAKAQNALLIQKQNDIAQLTIDLNNAQNAGDIAGIQKAKDGLYAIGGQIGMRYVDAPIRGADDALAKVSAANVEHSRIIEGIASGGLDPTDEKNKKGVDQVFVQDILPTLTGTPAQQASQIASFVFKSGVVPPALASSVTGSLTSGGPSSKLASAQIYGAIRSVNPELANQFPADTRRMADLILTAQEHGAEDPVKWASDMLQGTPTERDAREKSFSQAMNESDPSGLKKWTESQKVDGAPLSYEAQQDLTDLVKRELIAGMPLDRAQAQALQLIQGKYGATQVATKPGYFSNYTDVMAYPPEKFYGLPSMSQSENASWMRDQLEADVGKVLAGGLAGDESLSGRLALMRDPTTTRSDGLPTYVVSLKGQDGVWRPLIGGDGNPMAWHPDWETSPANQRRLDEQKRKIELLDKVRKEGAGALFDEQTTFVKKGQ